MAVGVFFYLVPILTNFRATKRWNTNGRELREVTYVPLVRWSAGWSWNSRATRGGHFQLFFIHNIERWRCEDWLWMGKIVTGLCNSNSVIEQLFVYTLLANDFMAFEIVCRQVCQVSSTSSKCSCVSFDQIIYNGSFWMHIQSKTKNEKQRSMHEACSTRAQANPKTLEGSPSWYILVSMYSWEPLWWLFSQRIR